MKILLIHYRYYPSSGPERYLFNFKSLFEQKGHLVIPFSLDYDMNLPSQYESYFPKPVGSSGQFHLKDNADLSLKDKVSIIHNHFFNHKVYSRLTELIRNEKPDIAYVLQYWGKMSTSVFDACYDNSIPVVLRLSDFNIICPKNILYRDNEVCTLCLNNLINSVRYKCTQDSFIKSFVNYLAYQYNFKRGYIKQINHIISPSVFTKTIIQKSKYFNAIPIEHIPTFYPNLNEKNYESVDINKRKDLCYLGRISSDKGLDIIVDAMKILETRNIDIILNIYGDVETEYGRYLLNRCKSLSINNIVFKGYFKINKLLKQISHYKYSIISSTWYDNMPNSLVESMAVGVPVISSEIGSFKELIINRKTGFLFKTGSAVSLANSIEEGISFETYEEMSHNCKKWVEEYCSQEKHYESLFRIFKFHTHEKTY